MRTFSNIILWILIAAMVVMTGAGIYKAGQDSHQLVGAGSWTIPLPPGTGSLEIHVVPGEGTGEARGAVVIVTGVPMSGGKVCSTTDSDITKECK